MAQELTLFSATLLPTPDLMISVMRGIWGAVLWETTCTEKSHF